MKFKTYLKSLLIWLTIIPLAIINGGLRDKILAPRIGMEYALPLSGIILCGAILLAAFVGMPFIGKHERKTYLKIGLLWIIVTLIFEFAMGYAIGRSTNEMLVAYDITTGNLWTIIVLLTGVAPYLSAKFRRYI